jgi:hypothetical protein
MFGNASYAVRVGNLICKIRFLRYMLGTISDTSIAVCVGN